MSCFEVMVTSIPAREPKPINSGGEVRGTSCALPAASNCANSVSAQIMRSSDVAALAQSKLGFGVRASVIGAGEVNESGAEGLGARAVVGCEASAGSSALMARQGIVHFGTDG